MIKKTLICSLLLPIFLCAQNLSTDGEINSSSETIDLAPKTSSETSIDETALLDQDIPEGVQLSAPTYCYFVPPSNWSRADAERLSPRVKMGFVGKTKSSFAPSLNLAVEKIDISAEEYIQVVKKIHQGDRKNQWRDLGKIQTTSGEARLTAIDTTTDFGPVRLMQVILVKDNIAYVLTGGALKEDFSHHYQEFQQAFQSLTVTHELPVNLRDHPHLHSEVTP